MKIPQGSVDSPLGERFQQKERSPPRREIPGPDDIRYLTNPLSSPLFLAFCDHDRQSKGTDGLNKGVMVRGLGCHDNFLWSLLRPDFRPGGIRSLCL